MMCSCKVTLATILAVTTVGQMSLAQSTGGHLRGDKEPLADVVRQLSANLDQIQSWRGNASVTLRSVDDASGERKKESSVAFLYDAKSGAERSLLTTKTNTLAKDGKVTSFPAIFNNGLAVNDRYVHIEEPVVRATGAERQIIILPRRRARPSIRSDHFSPMWHMTSSGKNIVEKIKMLLDPADAERSREGRYWQTSKDGSLVSLGYVRNGKVQDRWVFDLQQGANLVEFWGDDGTTMERYRYSYENVGGAWVPKTTDYDYGSRNPRSPLRTEAKHIEWTNEINVPVDPKDFSWEAIGAAPGDFVSDTLAGVSYVYRSEAAGVTDSAMQDIDDLASAAATQVAGSESATATHPVTQPVDDPNSGMPVTPKTSGKQRAPYLWLAGIGAGVLVVIVVVRRATSRRETLQ